MTGSASWGPTRSGYSGRRARQRLRRIWLAAALGLATALGAVDVAAADATLISFLVAPPIVAAIGTRPRSTMLVGAYSVAVAVVLGVPDHVFFHREHLVRIGVVALGAGLGTWIAFVRRGEWAARRRYALVARVGEITQASLDPEVMVIEVAKLAASELADWCFVFLRDDGGGVRQVAAVHEDPERQRQAWELLVRYPLDLRRDEGPAAVIREGRSRMYREVDDDVLRTISQDDENLELLRALGMRSAMVVPLAARGRVLGAMAMATAESGRTFDEADLAMGETLAARVAVALDNAELYVRLSRAESGLRASRDELQAILDGVADAVTAQRPDGQLVYANHAAVRTLGFDSVDELLATPVEDIVSRFEYLNERGEPVALDELPGRRALAGQRSPEPMLVQFGRRGVPGRSWVRIKAEPVVDEDGKPILAINVMEDVTEVHKATEAQRFLSQASAILASSLDYKATLANVARLAVPRVADWCAVDVLENGEIKQVSVAHSDPAKVELAVDFQRRYPVDPNLPTGVPNVLRTGQPELTPDVPDELLVDSAPDEFWLETVRSLGMRSAMIVPMVARGPRMLGAITLVSAESGRRFDEEDLALAQELAGRCALAVDASRLFRDRDQIRQTLQESLLPAELSQPPGVEVAGAFKAVPGEGYELGGDFYDLFETGPGTWGAIVGDVCGKGPDAAKLTAQARYTLRTSAMRELSPSRILAELNEAMLRASDDKRFCTVLYVRLELAGDTARLCFSSGGHPLPVIVRAGGAIEEVGEPGTLIGVVPDPDLEDEVVELGPGDAVVLYTDGLTDASAPDVVWDPEELVSRVRSAGARSADEIAKSLLNSVEDSSERSRPRDDIAILVLRMHGEGPEADHVGSSALTAGRA